MKDDLSERQRTINQHTEAVAASAGNVAKIRALETSAKEDMHLGKQNSLHPMLDTSF